MSAECVNRSMSNKKQHRGGGGGQKNGVALQGNPQKG